MESKSKIFIQVCTYGIVALGHINGKTYVLNFLSKPYKATLDLITPKKVHSNSRILMNSS